MFAHIKNTTIKHQWVVLFLCLSFGIYKAQPLHEYFFAGNLNGTAGGPVLTQNLACGAALGAFGVQTVAVVGNTCAASNVFCFNQGGGLSYNNPAYIGNQYSINLFFKFNNLGGWSRIIDFSNSTADAGIYLLNDCLNFFPNGNVGPCPYFLANTYYLFTFVRNGATGQISCYVNGVLFGVYNDAVTNIYYPATNVTPIVFFRDDNPVPCEAKAGCVRYMSVTSATMTPGQILTTFTNICNVILPIELSTFNAKLNSSHVDLDWSTFTESKNKVFEIERSNDGVNYKKIDEVEGSGDSHKEVNYKSNDFLPEEGVNYYRLKQIDYNGKFMYSNVVSVNFEKNPPLFYPNPTKDIITIKSESANTLVIIKDIIGQEVYRTNQLSDSKQISTADLPQGTYFISINDKVQKLIISK